MSKLNELRSAQCSKGKRPSKRNRFRGQRDQSDSATENSKDATGVDVQEQATETASTTITRSMPRLLSALTSDRKLTSSSFLPAPSLSDGSSTSLGGGNLTTAISTATLQTMLFMTTTTTSSMASASVMTNTTTTTTTTTNTTDDESLNGRRKSRQNSSNSKHSLSDTFPASISNKKKTVLLDAFGQPRKSPREHASTLAILSTIVQQRRKRFKELNGGISPEKLSNFAQNGLAEMTDDDDSNDDSCATKNTENGDNFDLDSQGSDSMGKLDKQIGKLDEVVNSSEGESTINPPEHQGHKFLLRKGMRRQASERSISGDPSKIPIPLASTTRASASMADDGEDDESSQKEFKYPKMPVDDYVDPNVVAKQLDELLNKCYEHVTNDLEDFPSSCTDTIDTTDLVLVNTPKDFIEIVSTVKEGPLTYRSMVNANKKSGLSLFMSRGKKRRNNKTGWPSVPKRKQMFKREKIDGHASEDGGAMSNTEDDDTMATAPGGESGDVDRIDISTHLLQNKSDEFFIQSRQNIKQENDSMDEDTVANGDKDGYEEYEDDDDDGVEPFLNENDNAINNIFATSSSEKAENSDIFTVSSDSLDTTDLTANGSDVIKRKTTPQNVTPKVEDESTNETDDEESSDATTINDFIQKKVTPTKQSNSVRAGVGTFSVCKMETRAKGDRNILPKYNHRFTLQPVVCVKKICEKDYYRRTYNRSSSTSPQKTKDSSPNKQTVSGMSTATTSKTMASPTSLATNRNSSSPKTKVSPRKLRKPRGQYYKER